MLDDDHFGAELGTIKTSALEFRTIILELELKYNVVFDHIFHKNLISLKFQAKL